MDKLSFTRTMSKYLVNPIARFGAGRWRGSLLLETTGRRTGLPRQTPLGYSKHMGAIWIVAEHGRAADYVRNLSDNPRVSVRMGGHWKTGTAKVLPDEDPAWHLERQRNRLSAMTVRLVSTDQLVIKIELD